MNTFWAKKVLNHDFGKVTVNSELHNTVSCNWTSQFGSLEKSCHQEEADAKVIIHTSDCLKGFKVIAKMSIFMLVQAHYRLFPCSCDIMVNWGFLGNPRFVAHHYLGCPQVLFS